MRSIFDDARKNFEFSASRAKLWSNVAETNISHGIKYCAVFVKRKTHLCNFSNLDHLFQIFLKQFCIEFCTLLFVSNEL